MGKQKQKNNQNPDEISDEAKEQIEDEIKNLDPTVVESINSLVPSPKLEDIAHVMVPKAAYSSEREDIKLSDVEVNNVEVNNIEEQSNEEPKLELEQPKEPKVIEVFLPPPEYLVGRTILAPTKPEVPHKPNPANIGRGRHIHKAKG